MYRIFISLFVALVITAPSFSQDGIPVEDAQALAEALAQAEVQAESSTWRSLSFYLDSFSGHLTEDPGYQKGQQSRVFSGNEFEFGVTYAQNFAKAPWFSIWVKALVVTSMPTAYSESTGNFIGNNGGAFIPGFGAPRAQIGLNFAGYSILALDTRGVLANENYYTLDFGNKGNLTFITILELWAVPQYSPLADDPTTTGIDESSLGIGIGSPLIVDLFSLRMDYGINFAPDWRFNTKLSVRFGGNKSAQVFKESFAIRWENQVLWAVTDKFYMWTQLRYNVVNLANDLPVDNQLFLQAGLGYAFDFSDK